MSMIFNQIPNSQRQVQLILTPYSKHKKNCMTILSHCFQETPLHLHYYQLSF